MELKMTGGDYVFDAAGGLCSVDGTEELVQRAMMRLGARRGGFSPLPDYGSRMYQLCRIKPGQRAAAARQYAAEALAEETEVCVEAVEYQPVGDDGAAVCVTLRCGEETAQVHLTV